MPDLTIDLTDRTAYPTRIGMQPVQVWTSPTIGTPFSLRPDLIPVDCQWHAAPGADNATLEYRYGLIIPAGRHLPQILTPITTRGYWVIIRWRCDDGQWLDWAGYAEYPVTRDHTPPRGDLPAAGQQTIQCSGFARALDADQIRSAVYLAGAPGTPVARRSGQVGLTANAPGGTYGRSAAEHSLTVDGPSAYVFDGARPAATWSTRQIVDHLLAFHLPRATPPPPSGGTSVGIPWAVGDLTALPDWDTPAIDTDGRTLASLLAELISPSRLLGWTVTPQIDGDPDLLDTPPSIASVTIDAYTATSTTLPLPGGDMPPNQTLIDIVAGTDPLTTITTDIDATASYDQVVVQGPREIGIGTLEAYPATAQWQQGWTSQHADDYAAGGSAADDWATLDLSTRRRRNELARSAQGVSDAYRLWTLPADYDWTTTGGGRFFFTRAPGDPPYQPSPLVVSLDPASLHLYQGVDYSGAPAQVNESPAVAGLADPLPPLWFWRADPDDPDSIALLGRRRDQTAPDSRVQAFRDFDLQPQITTRDGSPAVLMVVRGAPQHAIAGGSWVGNDADVDQATVYGDQPPGNWAVVVAAHSDRRPSWSIPPDDQLTNLDVARRRIITIDDADAQLVHIAAGTVLGFAADGSPQVSDGGILRDPLPLLQSLCQLAYTLYGRPQYHCSIRTARRLSAIRVGAMLRRVDLAAQPIDATVASITITAPLTEGDRATSAQMTITAASPRGDIGHMLRGRSLRGWRVRNTVRRATPAATTPARRRRTAAPAPPPRTPGRS